jgi:ribosomal protein S18 acetylase RimI-like enzyme
MAAQLRDSNMGKLPVIRLPDADAVLAATSHDHYVRNTIRPAVFASHGWQLGTAVAWLGIDAEAREPVLSMLGPDREVAELLAHIAADVPAGMMTTVPVTAAPLLSHGVEVEREFHWRFRTTTTPPSTVDDVAIRVLPGVGEERIANLLRHVGGFFSAWPGDPAVNRWAVVEDQNRVVACAADTSGAPGVGHMGSVAVHPQARGRGLAFAVVSWLTADLLAQGCDVVAVGVFAKEAPAQRLYDRVGFRTEHEFFTGPLHLTARPG